MSSTSTKIGVTLIGDRILVEPIEPADETDGGIFLPSQAKGKIEEGRVVAAGPGRWERGEQIPMTVKVGDRVRFLPHSATNFPYARTEYLILNESAVLAVLEG